MQIGDLVVRKSYGRDITFKIIDICNKENEIVYVLKGINLRIMADALGEDLDLLEADHLGQKDEVFNKKVKDSIKKVLAERAGGSKMYRLNKAIPAPMTVKSVKELTFGRPGKILHIDGDPEYLEVCLKVYKQLSLDAVGKVVAEKEQPSVVVQLVKEVRPDIVVMTGHDGILKGTKDFLDLNNYRNSKYFVQAVTELRNYEANYDDLVIFAGACQSCYEAILDAGANRTKLRCFG